MTKKVSKPKKAKTVALTPHDGQEQAAYDTSGTLPEPTERRRSSIAFSREKADARRLPFQMTVKANGASLVVGSPHADQQGWVEQFTETFGTASPHFAEYMLDRLGTALKGRGGEAPSERDYNAGLAFLDSLQPANELEATLALQIFAMNKASLDLLAKAQRVDTTDHLNCLGNMATKLQRTMIQATDSLAKLRRGGEQVVKVVYVDARTQTVVGEVHNHSSASAAAVAAGAVVETIPHAQTLPQQRPGSKVEVK